MSSAYERASRAAIKSGLLTYEKAELAGTLQAMSVPAMVTFAASCARRIATTAVSRGAEMSLAREAIEHLRNFASGSTLTSSDALEAQLIASIPDEDEAPDFEASIVEDALAAAAFGLRCAIDGDVMNAVWASSRAHDTVFRYAGLRQNETEFTEMVDLAILSHPFVQSELRRQRRDLDDLCRMGCDTSGFASLIDRAAKEPLLS